jgi:hypothetical protein
VRQNGMTEQAQCISMGYNIGKDGSEDTFINTVRLYCEKTALLPIPGKSTISRKIAKKYVLQLSNLAEIRHGTK